MTDLSQPFPVEPPLPHGDIEELSIAILAAYPQLQDVVRRIYYKWGIRIGEVVYLEAPGRKVVGALLEWAESEGRTRELLSLLWSGNPGNSKLAAIGQRLLGPLAPIAARYELKRQDMLAAAPVEVSRESLEKIVTDHSPLVDFTTILDRLTRVGRAVCRVETPLSMGTGFLVGRQSVLTNYHVVEEAIENGTAGAEIGCRFDFLRGADGSEAQGMLIHAADGDWLRASSPYSESDIAGAGEPLPGQLDFALIRLSAPVEETRLALPMPPKPPIVAPMDIAIIVQHPDGNPLKLAIGKVVEFPASGLRYRYNTTTKAGSSGAPVISAAFELIGLHHAADPALHPSFNQAVPIWHVAAAIAQAGLVPPEL